MILYMLETKRGSPDVFQIIQYERGKHYDVPHTLACQLINKGYALEIPEEDRLTLPNPAMSGFNANAAARKSEGA